MSPEGTTEAAGFSGTFRDLTLGARLHIGAPVSDPACGLSFWPRQVGDRRSGPPSLTRLLRAGKHELRPRRNHDLIIPRNRNAHYLG